MYFLNFISGNEKLRQIAKSGLDQVFKNDKRGQVSYMVVRSINHHLKVKKRERVKPEMLNVLISLKLYHLDNPKDIATAHLQALNNKTKKKREEMSKKERKMAKNRAKLGMYNAHLHICRCRYIDPSCHNFKKSKNLKF